jgi:DNA modification methylase
MSDLLTLAAKFEGLACNSLSAKAAKFELLATAANKPKVVKLKDGWVINGEFGSEEVDKELKKILGGKKLNLVCADPPYSNIVANDWDKDVSADDYLRWTNHCLKYLNKGGSLIIWGGIGKPHNRVFFEFLSRLEKETKGIMRNLLTWGKKRFYGKVDDYGFAREEAAWIINDAEKPKLFHIPLLDKLRGYEGFNDKYKAKSPYLRLTNVITHISELFSGKIHICEKPVKLMEIFVKAHSNADDIVLDPFAGSGSTGEACRNSGRKFILIERDPTNFKKIVKRLKS